MVPGDSGLLRAVVKVDAESGKIFGGGGHSAAGGKTILLAEGVAAEERVAIGKIVINANGALILEMSFVADVEVIVGVGGAAQHHHVRHGDVLHQEGFEQG